MSAEPEEGPVPFDGIGGGSGGPSNEGSGGGGGGADAEAGGEDLDVWPDCTCCSAS